MPTMDSQRLLKAGSGMTGSARPMKILILGGTAEARALAGALAHRDGMSVTLSLAGRTAAPAAQPVPVRRGGFGGADGLARHLRDERIGVLINAAHPYAATISANAARAADATGVPLLALRRPGWRKVTGDNWIEVESIDDAVAALGKDPRRVFLALGRKELQPFAAAPQHSYLVRSVDPVDPPLAVPHATYITARGPFSEAEDRALLEQNHIEIIVAKNSGGEATYGKIAAARALQLPVIMLKRPALPEVPSVETVEEVLDWLDHALTPSTARGV
jgi:precorrin-6A/cobalt-precorrin-6A reductase